MKFAAAAGLVALAMLSTPARAEDPVTQLNPVGPYEPIIATIGNKRVIAFYLPDSGNCAVNAVVWDNADADSYTAARVRISLKPQQMVHIDSVDNRSLNLQCGDNGTTLAVVDAGELVAFGGVETGHN
jgi:hypothetical protein